MSETKLIITVTEAGRGLRDLSQLNSKTPECMAHTALDRLDGYTADLGYLGIFQTLVPAEYEDKPEFFRQVFDSLLNRDPFIQRIGVSRRISVHMQTVCPL